MVKIFNPDGSEAEKSGNGVRIFAKYFKNRINTQIVKVLDRNNIQIEIYERGAGYTLASGSSSCAAAGASFKLGLVDNNIILICIYDIYLSLVNAFLLCNKVNLVIYFNWFFIIGQPTIFLPSMNIFPI